MSGRLVAFRGGGGVESGVATTYPRHTKISTQKLPNLDIQLNTAT